MQLKESINYSVNNLDDTSEILYYPGGWKDYVKKDESETGLIISDRVWSQIKDDFNDNVITEICDIFEFMEVVRFKENSHVSHPEEVRWYFEPISEDDNPEFSYGEKTFERWHIDNMNVVCHNYKNEFEVGVHFDIISDNKRKRTISIWSNGFAQNSLKHMFRDINWAARFCDLVNMIYVAKDETYKIDFFMSLINAPVYTTESISYSVNTGQEHEIITDEELDSEYDRVCDMIESVYMPELIDIFYDFRVEKYSSFKLKGLLFTITNQNRKFFTISLGSNIFNTSFNTVGFSIKKDYENKEVSYNLTFWLTKQDSTLETLNIKHTYDYDGLIKEINSLNIKVSDHEVANQLAETFNLFVGMTQYEESDFYSDSLESLVESVDYSVNNLEDSTYDYHAGDWRTIDNKRKYSPDIINKLIDDLKDNIVPEVKNIFYDFENSDIIERPDRHFVMLRYKNNNQDLPEITFLFNDCKYISYQIESVNIDIYFNNYVKNIFQGVSVDLTISFHKGKKVNKIFLFKGHYISVEEQMKTVRVSDYLLAGQLADLFNLYLNQEIFTAEDLYLPEEEMPKIKVIESVNYSVKNLDSPDDYTTGDWRIMYIEGKYSPDIVAKAMDDIKDNIIPEVKNIFFDFENSELIGKIVDGVKFLRYQNKNQDTPEITYIYNDYKYSSYKIEFIDFTINCKREENSTDDIFSNVFVELEIWFHKDDNYSRILLTRSESLERQIANIRVSDYMLAEQLADLFNLFINQYIFTADDFYIPEEEMSKMMESIDYSISNIDEYEYRTGDYKSLILGTQKDDFILTDELFNDVIEDFENNVIPEVQEIFPFLDNIKFHKELSYAVWTLTPGDHSPDFKYVPSSRTSRPIISHINKISISLTRTRYIRLLSLHANVEIASKTNKSKNYLQIWEDSGNGQIYNSLYDYEWAERFADFYNIIQIGRNVKWKPENLLIQTVAQKEQMNESINYSVANIDNTEGPLVYTNAYDFAHLKSGEKINLTYFMRMKEDFRDNIIPELQTLVPDMEFEIKADTMNSFKFQFIDKDFENERFKFERYTGYLYRIACVCEFMSTGYLKVSLRVAVKEFYTESESLIREQCLDLNTTPNSDLFTVFGYFRHQIGDMWAAELISDIYKIGFGISDERLEPENLYDDGTKKSGFGVSESINYSIANIQDDNIIDYVYDSPYAFFRLPTDAVFSVEGDYYDYFCDDIKENIIPDILSIFPEFHEQHDIVGSDEHRWELIAEDPYELNVILKNKGEYVQHKIELYNFEIMVIANVFQGKTYELIFSLNIQYGNMPIKITMVSDEEPAYRYNKSRLAFRNCAAYKKRFEDYDEAYRLSALIALLSPEAGNYFTPEYFYHDPNLITESVNYSVSDIENNQEEYVYKTGDWRYFEKIDDLKIFESIKFDFEENILPEIYDIFSNYDIKTDFANLKDKLYWKLEFDRDEKFLISFPKWKYARKTYIDYISLWVWSHDGEKYYAEVVINFMTGKMKNYIEIYCSNNKFKIKKYRDDFKICSYEMCERIADLLNLITRTNDFNPDFLYEDFSLKESINYSITGLEGGDPLHFIDYGPYGFFNIPFGTVFPDKAISYYQELQDCFNDTIIPDIIDIFPELEVTQNNEYANNNIHEWILKSDDGIVMPVLYNRLKVDMSLLNISIFVERNYIENSVYDLNFNLSVMFDAFSTSLEIGMSSESKDTKDRVLIRNTERYKNKFINYSDALKISGLIYLFAPELAETVYTPEYFWIGYEDKKLIDESVNYSVSGLDTEESIEYRGNLEILTFNEPVDSLSKEYYEAMIPDLDANLIPMIQDLFSDYGYDYEVSSNEESPDSYEWYLKNDSDNIFEIKQRNRTDKIKSIHIVADYMDEYIVIRLNLNSEDSSLSPFTINVDTAAVYGYGEVKMLATLLNNEVVDYETCVILSELSKLFRLDYAPEFFFANVNESVNYSISSLSDNTDNNNLTYDSMLNFLSIKTPVSYLSEEYFDNMCDDIDNNFIPQLQDIFPQYELESSEGYNNRVWFLNLDDSQDAYIIKLKNGSKIKILSIVVRCLYNNGQIILSVNLMTYREVAIVNVTFDSSGQNGKTILSSGKVFKHNVKDFDMCVILSDVISLFNKQCPPEYFYSGINESVNYSVAKLDDNDSSELKYVNKLDFMYLREPVNNISFEYFTAMCADIKDNVIPELLELFPNMSFRDNSRGDWLQSYILEVNEGKEPFYINVKRGMHNRPQTYDLSHIVINLKHTMGTIYCSVNFQRDNLQRLFGIEFCSSGNKTLKVYYKTIEQNVRDYDVCETITDAFAIFGLYYDPSTFYAYNYFDEDAIEKLDFVDESVNYSVTNIDSEDIDFLDYSSYLSLIKSGISLKDDFYEKMCDYIETVLIEEVRDIFPDLDYLPKIINEDSQSFGLKADDKELCRKFYCNGKLSYISDIEISCNQNMYHDLPYSIVLIGIIRITNCDTDSSGDFVISSSTRSNVGNYSNDMFKHKIEDYDIAESISEFSKLISPQEAHEPDYFFDSSIKLDK